MFIEVKAYLLFQHRKSIHEFNPEKRLEQSFIYKQTNRQTNENK